MKAFVAAAMLAAVSATALQAQEPPADPTADWSPQQWSAAARTDVLESYRQFIENHPGVYDLDNPGFLEQLGDAREAGLAAADEASDRLGYDMALARFSSVLADGHARAYTPGSASNQDTPRYWPGFVALWRGDRLLVRTKDETSSLHGASITACEGQPIADFLSERLVVSGFRPKELGQWWVRPSQLFYSIGEVAPHQPRSCTFAFSDGHSETVALEWQNPTTEQRDFYGASVYPAAEPLGLSEPREGIFVIGLGDFQPDEAGRAKYEALYETVAARREELLAADAVVIDMRGNDGGSSMWSLNLARLLWGEEAVATRRPEIIGIDWRASRETIAYVKEMRAMFAERNEAEMVEWLDNTIGQMEVALEAGQPLWRDAGSSDEEKNERPAPAPTDFKTPVYVINWGLCASACLDANDYFKLFDNTRLIGAPTSADSTYMEIRGVKLPAGPGWLTIPNKTWVGRQRGWGEIYEPDIVMDQLDWSTEAFLDRIEADLAAG